MAVAKNKIGKLIILGFLLLIGLLISSFIYWATRPNSTKPAITAVQGASTTNSQKPLTTEHFTTTIPESLVVKSQDSTSHGLVLLQLFLASKNTSINKPLTDQLAITIGKTPSDGFSGITDVQFRMQRPNIYDTSVPINYPSGAQAFVKIEDGYELSVFWPKDSRYAAIVVSGTADRKTELNTLMQNVLSNWSWIDQ